MPRVPFNAETARDAGAKSSAQFVPGKSGNPGGRPSFAKAFEAADTNSTEVLAKLVAKALAWIEGDNPTLAQYAHLWLTERGLRIAKPKETVDLNIGGASPEQQILDAIRMTPQQRRDALAAQDTTETPAPEIDVDARGD